MHKTSPSWNDFSLYIRMENKNQATLGFLLVIWENWLHRCCHYAALMTSIIEHNFLVSVEGQAEN